MHSWLSVLAPQSSAMMRDQNVDALWNSRSGTRSSLPCIRWMSASSWEKAAARRPAHCASAECAESVPPVPIKGSTTAPGNWACVLTLEIGKIRPPRAMKARYCPRIPATRISPRDRSRLGRSSPSSDVKLVSPAAGGCSGWRARPRGSRWRARPPQHGGRNGIAHHGVPRRVGIGNHAARRVRRGPPYPARASICQIVRLDVRESPEISARDRR